MADPADVTPSQRMGAQYWKDCGKMQEKKAKRLRNQEAKKQLAS
jgi:hypothetical protein